MSTRNSNQKSEYLCEKKQNKSILNYHINSAFSEQPTTARMFAMGTGPSKMYSNNLSFNNIDIESKLRNINSTNLEGSDFNPTLQSKQFKSIDLFENRLKQNVYLPPPLIHFNNERPGFHNN